MLDSQAETEIHNAGSRVAHAPISGVSRNDRNEWFCPLPNAGPLCDENLARIVLG